MEDLFSFCGTKNFDTSNQLVITIDNNLSSMQAIYDYIGQIVYSDCAELNPIFENTHYFGKNFDAFHDCLRSYFAYLTNKAKLLRFDILAWNTRLEPNELFLLLHTLMVNISEDCHIQVFVSKEVLDIYLEETLRLFHLEHS